MSSVKHNLHVFASSLKAAAFTHFVLLLNLIFSHLLSIVTIKTRSLTAMLIALLHLTPSIAGNEKRQSKEDVAQQANEAHSAETKALCEDIGE